jgi:hypothetical protein
MSSLEQQLEQTDKKRENKYGSPVQVSHNTKFDWTKY